MKAKKIRSMVRLGLRGGRAAGTAETTEALMGVPETKRDWGDPMRAATTGRARRQFLQGNAASMPQNMACGEVFWGAQANGGRVVGELRFLGHGLRVLVRPTLEVWRSLKA